MWKGHILQRSKKEVTKIVSLVKIAGKNMKVHQYILRSVWYVGLLVWMY